MSLDGLRRCLQLAFAAPVRPPKHDEQRRWSEAVERHLRDIGAKPITAEEMQGE